jgi:aromatic-L-amino-acid decarboxylase
MGVNRFPNLWEVAPGMQQIEENVVRWLCDLFAFPTESRGILTTGGSIATLSAVVTARHTRLGPDFGDGTYYVSDQAHASMSKAATIAGFSQRNLRVVPTDAELRMDPEALRAMIRGSSGGLRLFLVVPAAGANTGAIDPLNASRRSRRPRSLWMHVDAAYGGFFQLTERGANGSADRAGRLHHARPGGVFRPRHGLLIVRRATLHDAMYAARPTCRIARPRSSPT